MQQATQLRTGLMSAFALRPLLLLGLCLLFWPSRALATTPLFTFQTALVIGKEGDCAGVATIDNGVQYYNSLAARTADHLLIKDGFGATFPFTYRHRWVDDGCNRTRHSLLLQQEAAAGTHFFYGSGPTFAQDESALSAQLTGATYPANTTRGRMMYQCCLGPDPIYEQNFPTVFGIQTSNKKYTTQLLKVMALQGVERLVVAYRTDNLFTSTTCEAGLAMLQALQKLKPKFQIVDTIRYTGSQVGVLPGALQQIVPRLKALSADAIISCDLKDQGNWLTTQLKEHAASLRLKAIFLTVSPSYSDYDERHGSGADYVTTPVQWHPAMTYADGFFGASTDYSAGFQAMFPSLEADYVSAGASAVGYTLSIAISSAFKQCNISRALGSNNATVRTDTLLFNADAINCTNVLGQVLVGKTGYQLILESLAAYQGDTFFGPVEFNRFRRNVAKVAAVTQWLDGKLECVLPLDAANKGLVLPIPHPPILLAGAGVTRTPSPFTPGVIVAIVAGCVCLLAVSAALFALHRYQKRHYRNFFGSAQPPGAGPETTLLVTDIESSTTLWEALSAKVMDQALKVHNATLRGSLAAHAGYESDTEGDSFILAFHTPAQALAYAVSVQAQLLTQDWPQEVLAHEACAPVCVSPVEDIDALPRRAAVHGGGPLSDWAASIFWARLYRSCLTYGTAGARGSRSEVHLTGETAYLGRMPKEDLRIRGFTTGAPVNAYYNVLNSDLYNMPGEGGPGGPSRSAPTRSQPSFASITTPVRALKDSMLRATGSMVWGRRPTGLDASISGVFGSEAGMLASPGFRGSASSNPDAANKHAGMNDKKAIALGQKPRVVSAGVADVSQVKGETQVSAEGQREEFESHTLESVLTQLVNVMTTASGRDEEPGTLRAKVLVFRGLRVRMGLHAGVGIPGTGGTETKEEDNGDVTLNQATGRVMFCGEGLAWAKQVSDCAAGGQVLLDAEVTRLLSPADYAACKGLLLHMGQHAFKDGTSQTLYQVVSGPLLARLPLFTPLRGTTLLSTGVLTAPVACAAVSFLHVPAAQMLLAWNASLAQVALQTIQQVVAQHVLGAGGYMAEVADGFVLSLYCEPGAALLGLLQAQAALTAYEWDEDLMRHELCEEIAVFVPMGPSASHRTSCASQAQATQHGMQSGLLPAAAARSSLDYDQTRSSDTRCILPLQLAVKDGSDVENGRLSMATCRATVQSLSKTVSISPASWPAALAADCLTSSSAGPTMQQPQTQAARLASGSGWGPVAESIETTLKESARGATQTHGAGAVETGERSSRYSPAAVLRTTPAFESASMLPMPPAGPRCASICGLTARESAGQAQVQTHGPGTDPAHQTRQEPSRHVCPQPGSPLLLGRASDIKCGLLVASADGVHEDVGAVCNNLANSSAPTAAPNPGTTSSLVPTRTSSMNFGKRSLSGLSAYAMPLPAAQIAMSRLGAAGVTAGRRTPAMGHVGPIPIVLGPAGVPRTPMQRKVLMRGPRLKASIDVGSLIDGVRPTTGLMEYRGRAMNRAARIAALATSGKVLVSGPAWDVISERTPEVAAQVCVVSLGALHFKGIAEPVEVLQAKLMDEDGGWMEG